MGVDTRCHTICGVKITHTNFGVKSHSNSDVKLSNQTPHVIKDTSNNVLGKLNTSIETSLMIVVT